MFLYKINENDETFYEKIAETKDINDERIRNIVKDGTYFLGKLILILILIKLERKI